MTVRIERDGPVFVVVLERPERRNAVDAASADALYEAFLAFDAEETAHVAVLYGAGGAFSAGWDLKEGAALADGALLHALDFPADDAAPLPRGPLGPTRLALSKPVIAAIAGPAVAGGMELALWCDLRVMEASAYMGVYCRRWGVPLVDGGTARLSRIVGLGRALDLVLTGRKVDAAECLRIGACDRVVEDGDARSAAVALAREIARFPQKCLRADRASMLAAYDLPLRAALRREWDNAVAMLEAEGLTGAKRFAAGEGRHGDGVGS